MANAKIINYGQQISAGSTAIPDNNATALDIESTDAKDYITLDTTDGNEIITLGQKTYVYGEGGSLGDAVFDAEDVVLYVENGTANSAAASIIEVNSSGSNGSQLIMSVDDAHKGVIKIEGSGDNDMLLGTYSGAGDTKIQAGGVERARLYDKGVTITGYGGTTGGSPNEAEDVALYVENGTANSTNACVVEINADGSSGSQVWFSASDALKGYVGYSSNKMLLHTNNSATDISLAANYIERLNIDAGTGATKITGPLSTVGLVATALTDSGGTASVSTSGSSTTLAGVNTTFLTDFHVGAAIKVGTVTTTVTAIASATSLTLEDAINTSSTGVTCTRDGGELFAVKTGDSKSLFSVNETGAIGCGSAAGTAHASNNIAIGDDDALDAITTGVSNVIVGGSNATHQLTTGSRNVIAGYRAGEDCTSTSDSVIIGEIAGAVGNMGSQQVLIGRGAGTSSTDINNVAVGYQAMYDCSGRNNVAMGHSALKATGSQDSCVALGMQALVAATGGENIGIGQDAGAAIEGGSSNICIGHQSNTGAAQTKSIAIGHQVAASVNQKAYIGDGSSSTSIVFSGSGNSWSTASDSRIKENVEDNALGLDFINALRPVKYTEINPQDWPEEIRPHIFFDKTATRINEETGEEETYVIPANERNPTCTDVFDGLIAQEVKAAADAAGTTFSGFEDSEPNGLVRLQYEKFVVPLIAACQDLSAQVTALTARVSELEAGD